MADVSRLDSVLPACALWKKVSKTAAGFPLKLLNETSAMRELAGVPYEADDEEADRIYEAIDAKMQEPGERPGRPKK